MIGLDTNVLVRYLAQDDIVQSARATEIFERQLTNERPGFLSLVTIAETVWVLDRVYGLSNPVIAAAVERILQADSLVIQNEREVFIAKIALEAGDGSFSDALIGALGEWAGCTTTVTFDRGTKKLEQFRLLS